MPANQCQHYGPITSLAPYRSTPLITYPQYNVLFGYKVLFSFVPHTLCTLILYILSGIKYLFCCPDEYGICGVDPYEVFC